MRIPKGKKVKWITKDDQAFPLKPKGISDESNASVEGKPLDPSLIAQRKVYGETKPILPKGHEVSSEVWENTIKSVEEVPYVDQLITRQHFGSRSGTQGDYSRYDWSKSIGSKSIEIGQVLDEMRDAYWGDLIKEFKDEGIIINSIKKIKEIDKNPEKVSDISWSKLFNKIYLGNPKYEDSIFDEHGNLKSNRIPFGQIEEGKEDRTKWEILKLLKQYPKKNQPQYMENGFTGIPYYFQTLDGDRVVGFKTWKQAVEAGLRYVTSSSDGKVKWRNIIKDWSKLDPIGAETQKSKLIKILQRREALRNYEKGSRKPLEPEKQKLSPFHTFFIGDYMLSRQESVARNKQSSQLKDELQKIRRQRVRTTDEIKYHMNAIEKLRAVLNLSSPHKQQEELKDMAKKLGGNKNIQKYIQTAIDTENADIEQKIQRYKELETKESSNPKVFEEQKKLAEQLSDSRNSLEKLNKVQNIFDTYKNKEEARYEKLFGKNRKYDSDVDPEHREAKDPEHREAK